MLRQGTWSVTSKKDPRWDGSGRALVGMFMRPGEAVQHVEQKKKELDEEPPEDLEWGYLKD